MRQLMKGGSAMACCAYSVGHDGETQAGMQLFNSGRRLRGARRAAEQATISGSQNDAVLYLYMANEGPG